MNTILIKPLLAVLLIVSTISYAQEKPSTDLSTACKEYINEMNTFFGKKKYDEAFAVWEKANKGCAFQNASLYTFGIMIKGKQTYYSASNDKQVEQNKMKIKAIVDEGLSKFPNDYSLKSTYGKFLEYDKKYEEAYNMIKPLIDSEPTKANKEVLSRFLRVTTRLIKQDKLGAKEKRGNFYRVISIIDGRDIKGEQSIKADIYANMGLFLSCEDIAKQAEKDKALLESKSSVRGYYLKAFETNKCKTNSTQLSIKKEQQKAVNQVKEYEIDAIAIDEYDDIEVPEEVEDDPIYAVVEKMPEYPGGKEALYAYLDNSIKYPKRLSQSTPSRMYFEFIIEKDGSTSNLKVLRGGDDKLASEYLKAIKAMPKWTPGEQRGRKVRVKHVLPVTIQLK